jgi:hypothetical protein
LQGLSHRGARDAELRRQFGVADAGPGLQAAIMHGHQDLVEDARDGGAGRQQRVVEGGIY